MSKNRTKLTDIFDQSTCGVCGGCEINQYFLINDSFVKYDGIFYSLREFLICALDFQIDVEDSKTTEICLDCKDKVVKFYHFKKRAKEVQKQKLQCSRYKQLNKEKKSKVVQNIIEIVENYTERCSISSIRVDEDNKKMTIVQAEKADSIVSVSNSSSNFSFSEANVTVKEEPDSDFDSSLLQDASNLFDFSDDIVIKQEPSEQPAIFSREIPSSSNHFSASTSYHSQVDHTQSQSRRSNRRSSASDDKSSSAVSKAALKMRAYRERLKKPENFHRYLRHQQQQREWNKRHYVKKQIMTGKPVRQRRSRAGPISYFEDFDESRFALIVDANKF